MERQKIKECVMVNFYKGNSIFNGLFHKIIKMWGVRNGVLFEGVLRDISFQSPIKMALCVLLSLRDREYLMKYENLKVEISDTEIILPIGEILREGENDHPHYQKSIVFVITDTIENITKIGKRLKIDDRRTSMRYEYEHPTI